MTKYFFLGALEALLFLIPVPLFLVLSSLLVATPIAFVLSLALAFLLIQRFAWPLFSGQER